MHDHSECCAPAAEAASVLAMASNAISSKPLKFVALRGDGFTVGSQLLLATPPFTIALGILSWVYDWLQHACCTGHYGCLERTLPLVPEKFIVTAHIRFTSYPTMRYPSCVSCFERQLRLELHHAIHMHFCRTMSGDLFS
jgi:hypothetical protein